MYKKTKRVNLKTYICTIGEKTLMHHIITKRIYIPNGCFDAYEVKVNKDIFKYQEKVKLISQFQRFFLFFNGLLEFASFP